MTTSGTYMIDPDGANNGVAAFDIECNMTTNPPTVIGHHDNENRTEVTSCSDPGCFTLTATYSTATTQQLGALVDASTSCRQHIKYECHNSIMALGTSPSSFYSFFHNRDGSERYYWGGSNPATGGCACKVDNSCPAHGGQMCNCDHNDDVWREDSGYLTTGADLPVTRVRAGDTDGANEIAFLILGPLECT